MYQINQFIQLFSSGHFEKSVARQFIQRAKEGELTREENPISHFCVFLAGIDSTSKEVFIGHHKKSDKWLFNGGHIERSETPFEAVKREMAEEWGTDYIFPSFPELLTITEWIIHIFIRAEHTMIFGILFVSTKILSLLTRKNYVKNSMR